MNTGSLGKTALQAWLDIHLQFLPSIHSDLFSTILADFKQLSKCWLLDGSLVSQLVVRRQVVLPFPTCPWLYQLLFFINTFSGLAKDRRPETKGDGNSGGKMLTATSCRNTSLDEIQ